MSKQHLQVLVSAVVSAWHQGLATAWLVLTSAPGIEAGGLAGGAAGFEQAWTGVCPAIKSSLTCFSVFCFFAKGCSGECGMVAQGSSSRDFLHACIRL